MILKNYFTHRAEAKLRATCDTRQTKKTYLIEKIRCRMDSRFNFDRTENLRFEMTGLKKVKF